MGLTIGQAPVIVAAQGIRNTRPVSFFDAGERDRTRLLGQDDQSDRPALFRESRDQAPRVGFGPDTLSTPAAALNALQGTVRNVREATPTLQEISIGLRRESQEQRALIRERQIQDSFERRGIERSPFGENNRGATRIEFRVPEPAAQARNFINTLNDAAGSAQARFSNADAPPQSGPTFQANGEQFPLRSGPGTILNLTA